MVRIDKALIPRIARAVIFLTCLGAARPGGAQAEFSNAAPRIRSGNLLFIVAPAPASVELDGKIIGEAPLLIDLSGRSSASLGISNGTGHEEVSLEIDDSVKSITRYRPALAYYTGKLIVDGAVPGTMLTIDGAEPMPLGPGPLTLQAGERALRFSAPGMAALSLSPLIEGDKETRLEIRQEPGFPLVLEPPPPEGTLISLMDGDRGAAASFEYGSGFLLAAGKAVFRAMSPGNVEVIAFEADPSAGPARSPFEPAKGSLALPRLPRGARLLLDGNEIAQAPGALEVARGIHALTLEKPGSLPFNDFLIVESGQAVTLDLSIFGIGLPKTKGQVSTGNAVFISLLSSGLATTIAGLALNADSISVAMSPTHDSYVALKYGSLGVMGLGLAMTGASFFFLGAH